MSDRLPMDLKIYIGDDTKLRGRTEGGVLHLEVAPGFVYGRFNRQEVLQKFAAAAGELAGREIRVMLSELKPDERPRRDIDELRAFKEVKFI